jgi:sulfur carrier protein ThiS
MEGGGVNIKVKLVGLRPRLQPAAASAGWYEISLSAGVTAGEIAGMFGLDNETVIVVRDKKPCPYGALLREGDRIMLVTMAEGG